MTGPQSVTGKVIQADVPVWEPLELAVGEELVRTFMWMYEIETTDNRRLQAYKHIHTRQYLYVDRAGDAYLYGEDDRYERVPLAHAIELALRPWWEELGATSEEVAEARAAIEGARRREARAGERAGRSVTIAQGARRGTPPAPRRSRSAPTASRTSGLTHRRRALAIPRRQRLTPSSRRV